MTGECRRPDTHSTTESASSADTEDESLTSPGSDSASATDTGTELEAATLGVISVEALAAALSFKDFLLINVHVPYEGEIPGTDINISDANIDDIAAYIGVSLQTEVVLYCKTNYMLTIAGEALVERGYRNISYLDGGMNAWTAGGARTREFVALAAYSQPQAL